MSGHSTANKMEEMSYIHYIETKINFKIYIKVDLRVIILYHKIMKQNLKHAHIARHSNQRLDKS
jgi:hypothetical protein